ncbi:hypothetical protein F511_21478 [Dorcoceras hygrometricum]|uniref:Uncharacterized protein n=1 Tax=Dorcoceras hygrometricum TaxID=472368 RepID=A0A2Z7D8N9_9LAMI|nr:hypothetical protein F511_21478 [Dorcoceras hygrometricum]
MTDQKAKDTRAADKVVPTAEPSKVHGAGGHSHTPHYPNPPESMNPDAATLRDQWRYAIRQYSRWYSQAWGTAILAGLSFFALGWIIKGSNPLPSFTAGTTSSNKTEQESTSPSSSDRDRVAASDNRPG